MRRTYTVDTGGVVRAQARGRGRSALALTVSLDVEALDEQLAREAEAEDQPEREGW